MHHFTEFDSLVSEIVCHCLKITEKIKLKRYMLDQINHEKKYFHVIKQREKQDLTHVKSVSSQRVPR